MANFLYTSIKEKMLSSQFNWAAQPVAAYLVSAAYVASATHQTLVSVPLEARVAGPVLLTNKSVAGNVARAANVLFSTVSGPPVAAVLLVSSGATDATSYLIGYLDQSNTLPFVPDGTDKLISWYESATGIFSI